jgi:UDP-N-acetylenolpyruvoylglucosamine reductase
MESDVLAATSMLATAVAILYSLWSPEVTSAMALDRAGWPKLADRAEPIAQISRVLRQRAMPLALLAAAQALILLPNTCQVVVASAVALVAGEAEYDVVRAASLTVWATLLLLAAASAHQAWELRRHLADFRTDG